ncbi:class I SAM-dependent methyltransferase [Anabaena lutea]|uniref:Class I SAM-dependent methyltransferase n=1 Tax=Anabaena lutea FACHB-196 TaxID=2692881 RepID=A0ABR8FD94_9NOST|nr:class I SAM-dependent methyltransferase [Anabaena lutea]MBD2567933.1 class I SAM-dependent methyltransferase [Anabaena lutea FACHB-196]
MPIYDSIGKNYSTSRIPDTRIAKKLIDLLNLPQGSIIADIGAGTGGYSQLIANQGFSVYAVEPSSVMRIQAIQHPQIKWFTGYAEALPLADKSVDAVISILTIHHFSDLAKAFQEMQRVVKDGAIILLTFDIRLAQKIWIYDYFPCLWEEALKFLPLNEIANLIQVNTQRNVEAFPLMLTHDLSDLFAAAAWRRPEMYLKPEVRAGISAFAFYDQNLIEQGVQKLMNDLSNGEWDKKYGEILNLQEVDIGYRFLRAKF